MNTINVKFSAHIPGGRHGEVRLTRTGTDVDFESNSNIPEETLIVEINENDVAEALIWPTMRGIMQTTSYRAEWRAKGADGWSLLGEGLRIPNNATVTLGEIIVSSRLATAWGIPALFQMTQEGFESAENKPDGLYLILPPEAPAAPE